MYCDIRDNRILEYLVLPSQLIVRDYRRFSSILYMIESIIALYTLWLYWCVACVHEWWRIESKNNYLFLTILRIKLHLDVV